MKTCIAAAALFAAGTICANALAEADGSFFGDFYAGNAGIKGGGDTDLGEISGKEWVSGCVGFSFTLENVVGGPFDDPVSDPYFSLGAITFAHGGFSGSGEVYLNVYTSSTPSEETFLGQSSELAAKKPDLGKLAFESVNFRNDDKASDIILEAGQTYYVFFSSTLINGELRLHERRRNAGAQQKRGRPRGRRRLRGNERLGGRRRRRAPDLQRVARRRFRAGTVGVRAARGNLRAGVRRVPAREKILTPFPLRESD